MEVDEDEETIKIVQLVKSQDTLREENINLPAATSHKVGNQSTHFSQLPINQPTSHSCLSINPHTVANQLTSHRWQSISPPRTVDTQVPVNQFTAHGGHTVASQSIPLKLWTHSCQSISPPHTVATESIHLAQCTQLLINQSASHSCQTIHLIQLLINQSTSQSCQSINPPHTLHYRYVPYGL